MLYVETNSNDPHVNLAYEEYFLKDKNTNEDIFMLWQNRPTIVVGRFQNSLQEINQQFVEDNNIYVIRRITGGGTVYHDLGNLCYTFILNNIKTENIDFSIFAVPVVKALSELGINAEISGRNDLTINDMKFSGTAMSLHNNKLLFHGTLLFDSNINVLSQALNVSDIKIQSKGIKSVKSRVTNIKPHLKENIDITDFKLLLKDKIFNNTIKEEYFLTENDKEEITSLINNKYLKWDWTYGNNPKTQIVKSNKYKGGLIEVHLDLDNGYIKNCIFMGDFLGLCDISTVQDKLKYVKYDKDTIYNILSNIDLKKHFGEITMDEILSSII